MYQVIEFDLRISCLDIETKNVRLKARSYNSKWLLRIIFSISPMDWRWNIAIP